MKQIDDNGCLSLLNRRLGYFSLKEAESENRRYIKTAQTEHELLTLRDERRVFQARFDSLGAVFVLNCRELGGATSLRLVLKTTKKTVYKETTQS